MFKKEWDVHTNRPAEEEKTCKHADVRKVSDSDSAQPPYSHNQREGIWEEEKKNKKRKTGAIFIEELSLFLMICWHGTDERYKRRKRLAGRKSEGILT